MTSETYSCHPVHQCPIIIPLIPQLATLQHPICPSLLSLRFNLQSAQCQHVSSQIRVGNSLHVQEVLFININELPIKNGQDFLDIKHLDSKICNGKGIDLICLFENVLISTFDLNHLTHNIYTRKVNTLQEWNIYSKFCIRS